MAKVSTNAITDYGQDWSNDTSTGLPYSGEAVQTFIKEELQKKASSEDVSTEVTSQIGSTLFGGGTRNVVSDIEGNSETLNVQKLVYENGAVTSKNETISIGTPDVNARFLSITSQLSESSINVGGETNLSYGFVVTDADGDIIPNSFANVVMILTRQGQATAFYTANLGSVESASNAETVNQTVNLTSILADRITSSATVNVTLALTYSYTYTDDEGTEQSKTITKYNTVALTVLSLVLSTSINIANTGLTEQVVIPYSVRGNGTKSVYLYKNGELIDTHSDITASTSSNSFTASLENGSANFQLVAETVSGNTTIRSSSFYFDLFRSTSVPVIALLVEDSTGTIQGPSDYKSPKFNAPKFNDFKFNYYVYSPTATKASLNILTAEVDSDGKTLVSTSSEQTVSRKAYIYSKKIKSSNSLVITLTSGTTSKTITINPMASSINIELPTDSLELNLEADGRSNEETTPGTWTYGNVSTEFSGFNWQSNGWITDGGSTALLLQNGAKAIVNFPLFQAVDGHSVTNTGCTFEILFKCKNATLDEHDLISCYWLNDDNKTTGLNVTTSYVGVNTGEETTYTDDDGNVTQSVTTRVGSQYAEGEYYKYIFVIDPNAASVEGRGLCYGFLNGILSYVAPVPSSFNNLDKLPITIDSTYADVYIKSIKYYNAPLTFDQCVDDYIIDQPSSSEIEDLYNSNSVLGTDSSDNSYVSPQKLREKGHGVIIVTPADNQVSPVTLQDLNISSNKKAYYGPFRIAYFAPDTDLDLGQGTIATKGSAYNFLHKACMIRIQGTTSTKRPRKNYRFQLDRKNANGDKFKPDSNEEDKNYFIVGGEYNNNYKYAMNSNAVAVPLICMKTDYVDSSMTHNTGGALVFNEMTKNISSLRNAAQNKEYTEGGNSVSAIKTRVAIEGFPVDVFAADSVVNDEYTDTLEDSNYTNLEYMGQYNFNNDKSKSGKVFGFDGAYTYDENGDYSEADGAMQPICIEFLDNQAALDNFQVKFDTSNAIDEDATYGGFADALEIRAPEDLTDQVADYGLDSLSSYDSGNWNYVSTALKRVFNFIGECAKEVATNNGITAYSMNNSDNTKDFFEDLDWASETFRTKASEYFNMDSILAWYIWTDYLIAADQRAKNMMLYTMDGNHWLFQYYDGDTALGERNDCFLAYDYLTDRDTYDYGVNQYAMQGHDSWLWYLVRANFSETTKRDDEDAAPSSLATVCQTMRASGKFSADYIKQVFNEQIVGNYSERQYNYSQKYKYIDPISESDKFSGTDIGINFINTAQGSREAHRSFTLENRFNLLDSKYSAGNYTSDAFVYYGNTNVASNKLTIVSSIPYYFGWNKSNTTIQEHQRADSSNNYTITLTVTGVGANNPANILGASRIKELTIASTAAWTVDSSKTVALANLQKLVAKDLGSNGIGAMYLTGCPLLTYVDISNSNFTALEGLKNSSKLEYLDIRGTKITSVQLADGSPISTLKLATPTGVYLSNLSNIVYKGASEDTLSAEDWSNINKLLINNCENVDIELLVAKLLNSTTTTTKYLRVTGINKTADITWLDQFDGLEGLDEDGGEYTGFGAQLLGNLYLSEYTDDDLVAEYEAKYPSITIHQPEYTIIEADETVLDESGGTYSGSAYNYTNLDNNTGYRTSSVYTPSGHITNILNRCHRYLGKVQTFGNAITLVGNPNDSDSAGQSFLGRDNSGTILLIQLADSNSTYYNKGYKSSITRRSATLDGEEGNGEVYVKIPGFWYKGINYNMPQNSNFSKRYTCFSSQTEKPSTSSEIKVYKIDNLKAAVIGETDDSGNTITEGLFRESKVLNNTNLANTVSDRISVSSNSSYDIYRITVTGYKKLRYPASIGNSVCCLFTDANGTIITDSAGSVVGTGELYCSSAQYLYNGMAVITTIPEGAVYFYLSHNKYVSGSITSDPCDIVLHKGSSFANGDAMTDSNASLWIADMEPEWQWSDPVCIAAAKCATDSTAIGLYTPFDGTKEPAIGGNYYIVSDLNLAGVWTQYSMRRAAYNRGLRLIDYEATKLIAMLFTAKYGRRNSQNVLGAGFSLNTRKLGVTREYGMTDTVVPSGVEISDAYTNAKFPIDNDNGVITYDACGSPNFLGIEDVHGNVTEALERAYYANETAANCGKIRITGPNATASNEDIRRVYTVNASGYIPTSVVHGKYCDICSCSATGASTATGYCDYQQGVSSLTTTWSNTIFLRRSSYGSDAYGGVFCLIGNAVIAYTGYSLGSRLLFRGNIVETEDIDYFEAATDKRE